MTRQPLLHTGTKQPLMGPQAELMLREAADGVPARPRHGETELDRLTRTWLVRNGWVDDRGEPTPKGATAIETGSWPPPPPPAKPRLKSKPKPKPDGDAEPNKGRK